MRLRLNTKLRAALIAAISVVGFTLPQAEAANTVISNASQSAAVLVEGGITLSNITSSMVKASGTEVTPTSTDYRNSFTYTPANIGSGGGTATYTLNFEITGIADGVTAQGMVIDFFTLNGGGKPQNAENGYKATVALTMSGQEAPVYNAEHTILTSLGTNTYTGSAYEGDPAITPVTQASVSKLSLADVEWKTGIYTLTIAFAQDSGHTGGCFGGVGNVAFLCTPPVSTWQGTEEQTWEDEEAWAGGVPTSSRSAVFDGSGTSAVNITSTAEADSVTVSGKAYTFNVSNSGSLMANALTVTGEGAALSITGSGTVATGSLHINGKTITVGSGATLSSGDVAVASGETFSIAGEGNLILTKLTNNGGSVDISAVTNLTTLEAMGGTTTIGGTGTTFNFSSGGQSIKGNVTIGTGATGTVTATDSWWYNASSDITVKVDGGTLDFGSNRWTVHSHNKLLLNSGTVIGTGQAQNGALDFDGTGNVLESSGTSNVSAAIRFRNNTTELKVTDGTLTLSGVLNGGGSINKTGEGTLVISSNAGYGGSTIVSAGTLTVSSAYSITSANKLQVASGATVNFNGGLTIGASGTYSVAEGGSLNINGTATVTRTDLGYRETLRPREDGNGFGQTEAYVNMGAGIGGSCTWTLNGTTATYNATTGELSYANGATTYYIYNATSITDVMDQNPTKVVVNLASSDLVQDLGDGALALADLVVEKGIVTTTHNADSGCVSGNISIGQDGIFRVSGGHDAFGYDAGKATKHIIMEGAEGHLATLQLNQDTGNSVTMLTDIQMKGYSTITSTKAGGASMGFNTFGGNISAENKGNTIDRIEIRKDVTVTVAKDGELNIAQMLLSSTTDGDRILTKAGEGTLNFTGEAHMKGFVQSAGTTVFAGDLEIVNDTIINTGTVNIGGEASLKNLSGSGSLVVNEGGSLSVSGSIDGTNITVEDGGTIAGGVDASDVTIKAGATGTFVSGVSDLDNGVFIYSVDGNPTIANNGDADAKYAGLQDENMKVTAQTLWSNTQGYTVKNDLAVTTIEHEGGALTLQKVDAGALDSVAVAAGALSMQGITTVSLTEMTIAPESTVAVYQGGVAEANQEGTVTITDTLTAGGGTLLANLTLADGSTLNLQTGDGTMAALTLGSNLAFVDGAIVNLDAVTLQKLDALVMGTDSNYLELVKAAQGTTLAYGEDGLADYNGMWFGELFDRSAVGYNLVGDFKVVADATSFGLTKVSNVPEPTTGTLSLLALMALAARRRRK